MPWSSTIASRTIFRVIKVQAKLNFPGCLPFTQQSLDFCSEQSGLFVSETLNKLHVFAAVLSDSVQKIMILLACKLASFHFLPKILESCVA